MDKYLVTYSAVYVVDGDSVSDAIDAGICEHEDAPEGTWDATLSTDADSIGDTWDGDTVIVCDTCGGRMLPDISTHDDYTTVNHGDTDDDDDTGDGYGWICMTPTCSEFDGDGVEVEDLVAVGVPYWVASRVCGLVDALGANHG